MSIASSYAISPNAIVMYGKMSDSYGETIQIKMHAINNASISSNTLIGNGAMIHRDNSGLVQYASFNVQSNMPVNTVVDLAGKVIASNDPSIIGKPISITTDASTGYATLTFGYSNYT
ncbi:MAG: hypothetical protein KGL95_03745 [Patescibacteria group bacterium]|nr:hypothetical protein [Patescibacteria group bacterium]